MKSQLNLDLYHVYHSIILYYVLLTILWSVQAESGTLNIQKVTESLQFYIFHKGQGLPKLNIILILTFPTFAL